MEMTAMTWITMAVILAFVWGGFLFALSLAMGKEKAKGQEHASSPGE